jgi:hypothetical protein
MALTLADVMEPISLELARFCFSGMRLVEEKVVKLAGAEVVRW